MNATVWKQRGKFRSSPNSVARTARTVRSRASESLPTRRKNVKRLRRSSRTCPRALAGKTIDVTTARRRARRERSRKVRAALAANIYPLPHDIKLYNCPFQNLEKVAELKPGSTNAIIVDIPYEKAWLPQVADLGRFASRFLEPGGLLLMMTGIQNIDDVLFELKKQDELTLQMKLETIWGETRPLLVTLMAQALLLVPPNPFGFIPKARSPGRENS